MSSDSSSSSPPTDQKVTELPTPPSRVPPPTGNLAVDSLQRARHVTELPCGRNSLMYGIAGGVGIGVIRGLSAGPMVAGNWAVGTFALISLGSWHICRKNLADERKMVEKIIQGGPQRKAATKEAVSETTQS